MKNQNQEKVSLYLKWILALVIGMLATAANATCSYRAENPYGSGPADLVATLNVSALTVGRDVPDGTVLYRQTVRTMTTLINCRNDGAIATVQHKYWLTGTPQPISNWNGDPFPGRIYQTGVPGIGVALWYSGNAFPYTRSITNCGFIGGGCDINGADSNFEISLVKIGPVSPGLVQGANLPRMQYDLVTDNTLPIMRARFIGNIQIVAQTCTTPNVTVALGSHKVSDFSGAGSGTPYRNFFIELRNCPAFHGVSASLINTHNGIGSVESSRTINANVIGISLTPLNGVVASQRGTIQLGSGRPGSLTATGIGVQLFRSLDGFLQFDTLLASGISPSGSSGASYTIPMQARYVQTGTATPTPGPANASVIFTINYQ